MKFEIKGVLHQVFEAKQVSDRFTKREFVLSVSDGKYDQVVLFEMSGDKISQLDELATGEEVTVHFNVRGRAWTNKENVTKYFNSLHAWKVEPAQAAKRQSAPPPPPTTDSPSVDDDCPF